VLLYCWSTASRGVGHLVYTLDLGRLERQDKLAKNSGCKSRTGKDLANHPGLESCAAVREGRREVLTEETMGWAQNRSTASRDLDSVRKAARMHRDERFTSLLHYVDVDRLRESFYSLQTEIGGG
jgi:hypothetical protein